MANKFTEATCTHQENRILVKYGLSWNFKKRTKGERTVKESFPWGDSVLLPKQKQKNNLKYPDLRDSDEVKELPSQCEDAFICSSWLEKG